MADPILDALLNVTFDTINAAFSEEPKVDGPESEERESRRERRKKRKRNVQGEEPFSGRWWKKTVPNTKRWIPYVMKYIEHGSLDIDFHGLPLYTGDLKSISSTPDSLKFGIESELAGGGVQQSEKEWKYPASKPWIKSICIGQKTFFNRLWIQIDPEGLLYETKLLEDGTGQISWKGMTVGFDGPWFFDTEATLKCIEIGKDEGEVILSGWKNAFTPRIVWQ